MSRKYQIAENRIIDVDHIFDAGREQAVNLTGDKIEGKFVTVFRVTGIEKSFQISGTKGDMLWKILEANAAPIWLPDDVMERPEHPAAPAGDAA